MLVTPSVSVVIPWRSDDPERTEIFRWCLHRWGSLTDYRIITPNDGQTEGPFNRSKAVNRGVALAAGDDVVIVSDADTAIRHGQPEAMIAALRSGANWVIGYSRFVHLAQVATQEALSAPVDVALPENPSGPSVRYASWESVCGLWAMRTEDYHLIGGNDEGFEGWGSEDTAFAMKADTLLGKHERLPGVGLHLFHELRPDRKTDASARANYERLGRYEKAAGDPEAMTALVRESL